MVLYYIIFQYRDVFVSIYAVTHRHEYCKSISIVIICHLNTICVSPGERNCFDEEKTIPPITRNNNVDETIFLGNLQYKSA